MQTRPALPRLDTVDVLRGLAIAAVILLHIWIRFVFAGVRLGRDWPLLLGHFVFRNGGNGVTVFFAVSGFLITLTSLRRFGSLDAMKPALFYRIRFARIMPLLLLLLAVLSGLHLVHVSGYRINTRVFSLPGALFAALTFHLNWLEAARGAYLPACWTVLWSLSIEEMFYLFFPLVCVALLRQRRWGKPAWILLGLALVAAGPFSRTLWTHTDLWQENAYLAGMASIATGCLTAFAVMYLERRWLPQSAGVSRDISDGTSPESLVPQSFASVRSPGFVALASKLSLRRRSLLVVQVVGGALILLIAVWPRWAIMRPLGRSGLDDSVLALAACMVMAASTLRHHPRLWSEPTAAQGPAPSIRGNPVTAPIRWFGRHSYELYLSHEFVVMAGVGRFAHLHPHGATRGVVALWVAVIFLLTAPVAWLLARTFSEPLNRRLRGPAIETPPALPHCVSPEALCPAQN